MENGWKKTIKGARILWKRNKKEFIYEVLPVVAMWALMAYLAAVIVSEVGSMIITQTLAPSDLSVLVVFVLLWLMYAGFCTIPTLDLLYSLENVTKWHEK